MYTRMNLLVWALALLCMASALLVPWNAERGRAGRKAMPAQVSIAKLHETIPAEGRAAGRTKAATEASAAPGERLPLSPETRRMILFGLWLLVAAAAALLSHRALSSWEKGKAPDLAGQDETPAGEQDGYFFWA